MLVTSINKFFFATLFLFIIFPYGTASALGNATLTIRGNNNIVKDVHVGDINLQRTENTFNIIMSNGSETVAKLNSMIQGGWFSISKIPINALISYNKSKNKMYFIDKDTGLIKEVDCYNGQESALGSVVSMASTEKKPKVVREQHTHPAIENCVSAKSHHHKNGSFEHTHNYVCGSGRTSSAEGTTRETTPSPEYNYESEATYNNARGGSANYTNTPPPYEPYDYSGGY